MLFKPFVTSTWGGFGARCFEIINPMAERLAQNGMMTLSLAKKKIMGRLQAAFMKRVAEKGRRGLEEMGVGERIAAVAPVPGVVDQNPFGIGRRDERAPEAEVQQELEERPAAQVVAGAQQGEGVQDEASRFDAAREAFLWTVYAGLDLA
jgi:hypothetical protein